jgi:polyhydroxybutyrate depolymerase
LDVEDLKTRTLLILLVILLLISGCFPYRSRLIESREKELNSPGMHLISLNVDDYERSYLLFSPTCITEADSLPLVLMFHGGGGTAEGVSWDTGWDDLAERECFLAAFPNGFPSDPNNPPSFRENPQLWNDGSGRFNREVDDIGFIEAMLADIIDTYPVDPGRIYAAGFSNGASMAFRVGIEMQYIFSAIAPVAGALWYEDIELSSPVSLLYMTGTADPLNPIDGGVPKLAVGNREPGGEKAKPAVINHVLTWTEALDCDPDDQILVDEGILLTTVYKECAGGSEVQYLTLEGIGHHWPGGKFMLPESLMGKRTNEVEATQIIWDFFLAHPRK